MTAEIIKFKIESDVDTILDVVKEEKPDEIIVLSYKDNTYDVFHTEITNTTRMIGALEIIKQQLLMGRYIK
jgi:hypothetical protein